ncbi:hypothetical protein HMPREF0758_2983 [Serratia odorifera DSM 4582]|uniref:Uncharacterized protein n=1 Tax=Serratia odorifera DSM 4582 TaxID=667129 RepID=D4E483_SEROD|nr:hypothetical protein HMPREF0758_2983 [Serratia odorifera DSM 4582]
MAKKLKITNWNTYNKALVKRGSLTFRLDEPTIQSWYNEPKTASWGASKVILNLPFPT